MEVIEKSRGQGLHREGKIWERGRNQVTKLLLPTLLSTLVLIPVPVRAYYEDAVFLRTLSSPNIQYNTGHSVGAQEILLELNKEP